jgi:hypothetical protein
MKRYYVMPCESAYGVWDSYLQRWMELDGSDSYSMSEIDAEVLCAELNGL